MKTSQSELIGEIITIADSSNTSLIGLKGKIVDETKELLIVETNTGLKKILKSIIKIKIKDEIIDGKKLVARPEERIKRNDKK